jgi:polyisoprenoid-binding protein YceI
MKRAALAVCLSGILLSGALSAQDAGGRYVIDAAQSDVHWLVYKAGALARLGHNHTIEVGDLAGSVAVNAADLSKSQFDLQFKVADLVVDAPALRATLGEEFASVPSPDDIEGTRNNMLSERVLHGEMYPQIRLTGLGPVSVGGKQELAVKVEILGRTVDLKVPTEVTINGEQLRATGEFELNHADLGMKPFSVMAGALQVGEKLSFSYDVTARRDSR